MASWNETIRKFVERLQEQDGQALAEYSLILALVFAACVAALGIMAATVAGALGDVAASFP
jgi:Flp pilus assembly pilin Flp